MENASKALLIAGGILIAMLVLSIGVILITSFNGIGSSYDQTLSAQQIQKFNSRFIKFEERQDITMQEIVSLVNYVKDYNLENETDIEVNVGVYNYAGLEEADLIEKIRTQSTKTVTDETGKVQVEMKYYECENIEYDAEGKVNIIEFK